MFPKVLWMRFGLAKETGNEMFLPPAVYNNTRRIILLNADERVSPKGRFLFSCLFHEFLHHINNVFDLPLFFDNMLDIMDDIQRRDIVKWVYEGDTKVVFLDG